METVFSANDYAKDGKTLASPENTASHNSQLNCLQACQQDSTCKQAGKVYTMQGRIKGVPTTLLAFCTFLVGQNFDSQQ